jgi:hypothetical protein
LEGFVKFLPDAEKGHIGLYRDEQTYEPVEYLFKLPKTKNKKVLVLDPMLATGNSSIAAINFIGKTENIIFDLLGTAQLSRIDGSVYTLRYDSKNCRLFLFFNQQANIKRVEYFELRNDKAELLNSKQALEGCYKEFNLLD